MIQHSSGTDCAISAASAPEWLSDDPRMMEVFSLAEKFAGHRAPVVIEGEAGSGRKRLARRIHAQSLRADKPLVAVDCPSFPVPGEGAQILFHQVNGLPSGVATAALGGTLILEEVTGLKSDLQKQLLQMLQSGLDIRIIATTSRPLSQCSTQGTLLSELATRLNVAALKMPALRNRRLDLHKLSNELLAESARSAQAPVSHLNDLALQALHNHSWPGNIVELRAVLERAQAARPGAEIAVEDLGLNGQISLRTLVDVAALSVTDWLPGKTLGDIEKSVILSALQYHRGNRTHTARALGISIRTLRNKIADFRKVGIHV